MQSFMVISLLAKDEKGNRKVYGAYNDFYKKPGNEELVLFYEYFHGDNGSGLGASHQTGWTSLVADLIGSKRVPKKDCVSGEANTFFSEENNETGETEKDETEEEWI